MTAARSAPRASLTTTCGAGARVGGQHAGGPHVGDAAVVVERAHGADDAEARLARSRQLHREGRADADAQRLREPDADLGLVAAAQPAPGVERRILEARVVAGEGDELDRLAEREGVGALHDVARRGVGHAGQRADLGRAVGGQPRGEVVALAHRAGVVAQRRDERGEPEHEQDDGAADRRARRCSPPPARGARARAGRRARRSRRRGAGAGRSRPPRRAAARPSAAPSRATRATPRRRPTTATIATSAPASGASSAQPGGCSLSASSRSPAAPRTASAPSAMPSAPATAPVRVARHACSAAIRPREKPIARWTPMVGRRRWTSAAVVAASIVAAGAQRDEREGDEQRDDDPGGRVDEHAHAAAGDEAHAADLGAGGARLLQEHVDAVGVGGPDERLVDRAGAAGPRARATRARRTCAAPRRAGRRRCRAPRRSRPRAAAQPPDLDVVADADVPRVGHAALDDDLVRAPVDVAPGDDRVAAPARVDERHAALLRRAVLRRRRRRR